jgi:hypothetical protein
MSATQNEINVAWRAAYDEGQGVWSLDIIFRGDDLSNAPWAMFSIGRTITQIREHPLRCLLCEGEPTEIPEVITLMHADVPWPLNAIAHVVCGDCRVRHDRPKIINLCWDKWCDIMPGLRRIDSHTHGAGHA